MAENICSKFHYIFIFILYGLIESACFICIIILCHISSKNPFKNHIITDLYNYFTIIEENNNGNLILQKIENINTNYSQIRIREEQDKYNINYSSENKMNQKIFLRHLVSRLFCTEIKDYFIKFKGRKLSDIFDLNYEKVHKLSIVILVSSCTMFGVLIAFIIIINIIKKKLDENKSKCIECSLSILMMSFVIARFVLSFILLYYIEKGDIEKYDDFLDCPEVRVKFFDKFGEINSLRKCFIAFFILNIIEQGIDKLAKVFDIVEKLIELDDKNKE